MLKHEAACFADRCGVEPGRLICVNAPTQPLPPDPRAFGAAFVGGSGEFDAIRLDSQWKRELAEWLVRAAEGGLPLFCSCYGHQLLATALGGRVEPDPEGGEIGAYEVFLTPNGREDPLFRQLPSSFLAQFGHKDHVVELPKGAILLAAGGTSPCQAYRLDELRAYATQFHPELTHRTNRERFEHYRSRYLPPSDPKALERVLARFEPSPATDSLLPSFLQLFVDEPEAQ